MLDLRGLHIRAALFRCIREFFTSHGFLEVDTPVRQPVIIPESNIEPLMSEGYYLQTSPELCMKRLLASGSGNIFQISPCFRKNERGTRHLEEFTLLEWYRIDGDYHDLMKDCEELLQYASQYTYCLPGESVSPLCKISGVKCLMNPPEKLAVVEAFSRYSPVSLAEALDNGMFDEILVEYVEPKLGFESPVFLMDYPRELASLARINENNSDFAERFELYISGIELANGFSELTDPDEQLQRFVHEHACIARRNGIPPQKMPERFLRELGNIKEAAGIALGVDRLLMLLTGVKTIEKVVSFAPQDF